MKLFNVRLTRGAAGVAVACLALVTWACSSTVPSPVPTFSPVAATSTPPPVPAATQALVPPIPDGESSSTLGVDVPIAGADHIQEGMAAIDWNSNPPTSGQHYAVWAPAGFYTEVIPDGYLVHNMEHGYVIVYYNCAAVPNCDEFKTGIETAIAAAGTDPNTQTVKVIAVPREEMTNPITYASWGHLYVAETFIPDELIGYIQTYRSNAAYAPEASLP